MQAWQVQAHKNQLKIVSTGDCQLCGAQVADGLGECIDKSAYVTHRLPHHLGARWMTIFMAVDAHALQHAEVHGRWNNHFHLARLFLIHQCEILWQYSYSPILSHVLDSYKVDHPNERIQTPDPGLRGALTVNDAEQAESDADYREIVSQWSRSVLLAYEAGYGIAEGLADLFLKQLD